MKVSLLTPDDVSDRLGIARRTAIKLMYQMPHIVISGTERKRIRITETTLDNWILKNSTGNPIVAIETGAKKKLQRRG